jgi:TRAP-type C4-dicarboxylate transport system substrate-binding protein
MKKLFAKTLIAASIAGTAFAVQAQEVTLKVHHFLSAQTFIHTGVFEPWCAKLGKESNNRIKCQIYPAMQLGGTPPQLFDQVRTASPTWCGRCSATRPTASRCRKSSNCPSR